MNVRLPRHLFRLFAICLVLGTPIVATVVICVRDADRGIASIARERSGLHCGMIAGDLLAAIERFRLTVPSTSGAADRAIETALRELRDPDCAAFVAGPRTTIGALQARERTVFTRGNAVDTALSTLPLADAVLALFVDIGDASGLTYDPTVDAVNLDDALVARIPGLTERLEQSAEILKLAHRRRRLSPAEIVAAEKLLGQAHEIGAMANDDFEGALSALPGLRAALSVARAGADRAEGRLATRIDADATSGDPVRRSDLRVLRLASIAAGQLLLRASDGVLEKSFDARIAAYRQTARLTIGVGALALAAGCVLVTLLWRTLRRSDRAELERAHQRAQILETKLARRNAERALRMTEQQFRAVFDGSHVGIAIVGRDERHIDANAALRSMFGDDFALLVTKATNMFGEVVRAKRDSHRTEHCFEKLNGELLWAELSLSMIGGGPDEVMSAIVLVHDITELKTVNARLDHETLHDVLTGLPNRVYFVRRLDAMIRARDERFAVAFIDLDHFKQVNDSLGHHAGDELLQLAAHRLAAAVRPSDFVARLHGDEFAVLIVTALPDSNEIDAIIARLHDALELSVETPTTPIRISASIGYVGDGASYLDPEQLLRDADCAMYRSKMDGRDRATVYAPAMSTLRRIA